VSVAEYLLIRLKQIGIDHLFGVPGDFVLGFLTGERVIVDRPYNDIQPWKYHRLVEIFGGGLAFDVHTEGQLEAALAQAAGAAELVFIEIHTDRFDCSESLRRAGEAMARTNKLG